MTKYKNILVKGGADISVFGGALIGEFGQTPFTVLDARSGAWQARKNFWLSLGIKSEVGRGENLLKYSDTVLEPDPKKRAKKKGVVFGDSDGTAAILAQRWGTGETAIGSVEKDKRGEFIKQGAALAIGSNSRSRLGAGTQIIADRSRKPAIPGRRRSENAGAWKMRTDEGYKTQAEIADYDKKKRPNAHLDESTQKALGVYFSKGGALDREEGQTGTSIFDPVLCEMFYRWYVPLGGIILDPFAGGSVRGVVASMLGYNYVGIDLRPEQVAANYEQARTLGHKDYMPAWIEGDSRDLDQHCDGLAGKIDAMFSCPPFFDLEQYSDDPRDLSNMTYPEFIDVYSEIISKGIALLKPNSFAEFVVGEVRDKDGMCRGFVPDTILLFEKHGMKLYNDAVLVTAVGSLSIRAGKQFKAARKLGRSHQQVLIFAKGDPRKAVAEIERYAKK